MQSFITEEFAFLQGLVRIAQVCNKTFKWRACSGAWKVSEDFQTTT